MKASQLVAVRTLVFNLFGDCRATEEVGHKVIDKLSEMWFAGKSTVHFLLTQDYQNELRAQYTPYDSNDWTVGNKIALIKQVRTDYENRGFGKFGLKDAKEYIEHVVERGPETQFIRNLPGYLPF